MDVALFDYTLPESLIAQEPLRTRDGSKLFVHDRATGKSEHHIFSDLIELLSPGDVLVFNDSKVFPARLLAHKRSGKEMEVFLLHQESVSPHVWRVMVRGHLKPSTILEVRTEDGDVILTARALEDNNDGTWDLEFEQTEDLFWGGVDTVGEVPIPPYVTQVKSSFKEQYQTVYAQHRGSAAAPTAGLHFTNELISSLKNKGVICESITLHVGLGTFRPVKTDTVEEHHIHEELVIVSDDTAERLNTYKEEGRRIVAVGTTTLRTLEALASPGGTLVPGTKWVDIFIYPPYVFRFTDALITNFHLPRSSLLMLVAAFLAPGETTGIEQLKELYQTAIDQKYRFYSFGDAMFIT